MKLFCTLILLIIPSRTTASSFKSHDNYGKRAEEFIYTPKIVGGNSVPKEEYLWFAYADGCGASLISSKHLLTAAHCVDVFQSRIRLGALCNNRWNCNQNYETFRITKKTKHPNYEQDSSVNDFGVIQINGLSDFEPVTIDSTELSLSYTSGFGKMNPDVNFGSNRLRHVDVTYVTETQCNDLFQEELDKSMMCAGASGKDACQGDSGGPLYDKQNKVLVGLVSWGYGCADPDYPGVYSRISNQLSWIKDTVCSDYKEGEPSPNFCNVEAANNSHTSTLDSLCDESKNLNKIEVMTNKIESEINWMIMDESTGTILDNRINFGDESEYSRTFCIEPKRCYIFTIDNSVEDGIKYYEDVKVLFDGKEVLPDSASGPERGIYLGPGCSSPTMTPTVVPTLCKINETSFIFDLTTDQYPEETSWKLIDINSRTVAEYVKFVAPFTKHKWAICLPHRLNETCHKLIIYDSGGNGIFRPGGFTIIVDDDQIVRHYEFEDYWEMETVIIGCDAPIYDNISSIECDGIVSCNSPEALVAFELKEIDFEASIRWEVMKRSSGDILKNGNCLQRDDDGRRNLNLCLLPGCYNLTSYKTIEGRSDSYTDFIITESDENQGFDFCTSKNIPTSRIYDSSTALIRENVLLWILLSTYISFWFV